MAGQVLVNEQKIDKPGTQVPEDAAIRLLGEKLKYVSRGGLKLEKALQIFPAGASSVWLLPVRWPSIHLSCCWTNHCQTSMPRFVRK